MSYGLYKYDLTVKDPRTGEAITSGVYVFVYGAGTKTLSTLYSNTNLSAKTNPITRTQFALDDKVTFYSLSTSHDIYIADDKGNTSLIPGVTPNDHILLLPREGTEKCFVFPMVFNAGGTETDTGLDFPLDTWIHTAMVEVVTLDATETVSVGLLSSETNGDADGILVGVSVATAGFIRPFVITETTTEDYTDAPYYGALMGVGTAGTSAANDTGNHGGPGHVVSGANAVSLTYTPSSSDTFAGYGYVFFRHLR